MGVVSLGSNISSLKALRGISQASEKLSATYERLSSGQRINRAADDAAGLAIATSLNSSSRIFTQAVKNVNDGISLLAIAEGGSHALTSIVIRIKELAEQSSSGTYGSTQRQALDSEAQALRSEFNRIIVTTEFNDISLLNGSQSEIYIEAGGNSNQPLRIGVESLTNALVGAGTFQTATSYDAGDAPNSVSAADVNRDGAIDIISTSNTDTRLNVFLGNDNGTFKSRVSYSADYAPGPTTVIDVNGDSYLDLVMVAGSHDAVSVFNGNGDGSFKAGVTYAAGNEPRKIVLRDFNGDGVQDLGLVAYLDHSLNILIGNSNGSFKASVSYEALNGPVELDTADFNGDGILDLVTAAIGNNTINILVGNSNGTFKAKVSYFAGIPGTSPNDLSVADLNGDGRQDIAVATSGGMTILLGNGDGSLKAAVSYTAGNTPSQIGLSDFNDDGIQDVLVLSSGDNRLNVLLGNSNGSYQAPISYAGGTNIQHFTLSDFNGDGVEDVALDSASDDKVNVVLGVALSISALATFSITSQSSALTTLTRMDTVLSQLASAVGTMGSQRSRLQIAANNLLQSREQYKAAESRIMDVDIAQESSELMRTQILQQAANSVLVQANQSPNLALQLLR